MRINCSIAPLSSPPFCCSKKKKLGISIPPAATQFSFKRGIAVRLHTSSQPSSLWGLVVIYDVSARVGGGKERAVWIVTNCRMIETPGNGRIFYRFDADRQPPPPPPQRKNGYFWLSYPFLFFVLNPLCRMFAMADTKIQATLTTFLCPWTLGSHKLPYLFSSFR